MVKARGLRVATTLAAMALVATLGGTAHAATTTSSGDRMAVTIPAVAAFGPANLASGEITFPRLGSAGLAVISNAKIYSGSTSVTVSAVLLCGVSGGATFCAGPMGIKVNSLATVWGTALVARPIASDPTVWGGAFTSTTGYNGALVSFRDAEHS